MESLRAGFDAQKNSKLDTATFKKAIRNKKLREQLGILVDRCVICHKLSVKSMSIAIPNRFNRHMGRSMRLNDGKEIFACKKCYPEHFEHVDSTLNPKFIPGYTKGKTELSKKILAEHQKQPE